jgi:hypothetical protein
MWLLKLDSSGSKVWAQGLSSVYINLGGIVSLAQAVDGGYLLAGEKVFGGSHLLKTDALGQVVWTQTYSNVSLESVIKTTDNEFVVAGTINDGTPDFWLPKISSSGAMEWNRVYDGSNAEICKSVLQTEDGGFALFGFYGFL